MLTRRDLIKDGGTATAAVWLLGSAEVARAGSPPLAGYLRRSSYDALLGSTFAVDGTPLRLTAVQDVLGAESDQRLAGSAAAFSLTLTGPAAAPLEQGTHRFVHPRLGVFDLFMVPAGDTGRPDARYHVTIDHSVKLPAGAALPTGPQLAPLVSRARAARRSHDRARIDLRFTTDEAAEVIVVLKGRGRRLRTTAPVADRRAHALLRPAARLPRGTYEAVITIVGADRSRVVERRRVHLH